MVESYALRIERQLRTDEFHWLLSHVSEEKRQRIGRFCFQADAQRTLLGELLARYAISRRVRIRPDWIHMALDHYGKPVLINPQDLCFNVSHAGDWVVCAVDRDPVGVDVEQIRPIDLGIAERFFSSTELLDLADMTNEAKVERFFQIWTLKESYLKMLGKGLYLPLDSFSIRISGNAIALACDVDGNPSPYFRQIKLADSIIAICARTASLGELNLMELEDLVRSFSADPPQTFLD